MKLYYYLLSVIAILFNLLIYSSIAQADLPAPQATPAPHHINEFNTISVNGHIKLILQPLESNQKPFFKSSGKFRGAVRAKVTDHTLYLSTGELAKNTTVIVGVHQLNRLIVDGSGSVTGKLLNSNSLSIDANTSGKIELMGMVNLTRILSLGNGLIHIQWVDSPRLRIDSGGNTRIQVAGIANTVEMRLRDNSHFNGQYLRIKQLFIQTRDRSEAKILVNENLRAFAYDQSSIYYYKKPAEITEYTESSGNILQMKWNK